MIGHQRWRGWVPPAKQPRPPRRPSLRPRRRPEPENVLRCPRTSWTPSSLSPRRRARRRPLEVALAHRWTLPRVPKHRSPSRSLATVLTRLVLNVTVLARRRERKEVVMPAAAVVAAAARAALSGGHQHHPRSDLRVAGLKVRTQWRISISREPSPEPTKLSRSNICKTDRRTDRRTSGQDRRATRAAEQPRRTSGRLAEEGHRKEERGSDGSRGAAAVESLLSTGSHCRSAWIKQRAARRATSRADRSVQATRRGNTPLVHTNQLPLLLNVHTRRRDPSRTQVYAAVVCNPAKCRGACPSMGM